MRMRKKRNLDERLEKCAEITKSSPEIYKNKWREEFFQDAAALCVEIGCGKGRFVTDMAKANPNNLYIAIEREKSAVVTAMEKAISDGIENLFFIVGDAENICEIFGYGEVDQLYVNFCDPWTGNKHAKRRLTHHNFLTLYRHILKPGGSLYFKTDNKDLFHFSIAEMREFGLELIGLTEDLHKTDIPNIMTEYEEKFSSQGVPINRVEAKFPTTPADPLPSKDEKRVLYTTLGKIKRSELNFILPHEHVFLELDKENFGAYKNAEPEKVYEKIAPYIKEVMDAGVDCIVEATPDGVGRRTDILEYVSKKINLPLIVATGYYYDSYLDDEIRELSRDQIARKMINEIMIGIEGTETKAGFIKVAVSHECITECEEKIFKAACRAAKATGAAIVSHTEKGENILKELEMVETFKLSPARLVWAHASNERNLEYHKALAEKGCYIAFDRIKNDNVSEFSIEAIKMLIEEGFVKQILISSDSGWYDPKYENGENIKGYTYIPNVFIPRMKEAGISEENIKTIVSENPFNAFAR